MSLRLSVIAIFLLAVAAVPLGGQSLKVNEPTHLAAGRNHGTIDSFAGDQFWDFYVLPGHFKLTFSGSGPQEGFSVGGHLNAAIAFVPMTPGAIFTQRRGSDGSIVFTGSVTRRTRVGGRGGKA